MHRFGIFIVFLLSVCIVSNFVYGYEMLTLSEFTFPCDNCGGFIKGSGSWWTDEEGKTHYDILTLGGEKETNLPYCSSPTLHHYFFNNIYKTCSEAFDSSLTCRLGEEVGYSENCSVYYDYYSRYYGDNLGIAQYCSECEDCNCSTSYISEYRVICDDPNSPRNGVFSREISPTGYKPTPILRLTWDTPPEKDFSISVHEYCGYAYDRSNWIATQNAPVIGTGNTADAKFKNGQFYLDIPLQTESDIIPCMLIAGVSPDDVKGIGSRNVVIDDINQKIIYLDEGYYTEFLYGLEGKEYEKEPKIRGNGPVRMVSVGINYPYLSVDIPENASINITVIYTYQNVTAEKSFIFTHNYFPTSFIEFPNAPLAEEIKLIIKLKPNQDGERPSLKSVTIKSCNLINHAPNIHDIKHSLSDFTGYTLYTGVPKELIIFAGDIHNGLEETSKEKLDVSVSMGEFGSSSEKCCNVQITPQPNVDPLELPKKINLTINVTDDGTAFCEECYETQGITGGFLYGVIKKIQRLFKITGFVTNLECEKGEIERKSTTKQIEAKVCPNPKKGVYLGELVMERSPNFRPSYKDDGFNFYPYPGAANFDLDPCNISETINVWVNTDPESEYCNLLDFTDHSYVIGTSGCIERILGKFTYKAKRYCRLKSILYKTLRLSEKNNQAILEMGVKHGFVEFRYILSNGTHSVEDVISCLLTPEKTSKFIEENLNLMEDIFERYPNENPIPGRALITKVVKDELIRNKDKIYAYLDCCPRKDIKKKRTLHSYYFAGDPPGLPYYTRNAYYFYPAYHLNYTGFLNHSLLNVTISSDKLFVYEEDGDYIENRCWIAEYESMQKTIGPSGGEIELGSAKFTFLPNAVNETKLITLKEVDLYCSKVKCHSNDDCYEEYSQPFCIDRHAYINHTVPLCIYPGYIGSKCISYNVTEIYDICDVNESCVNGVCKPTTCLEDSDGMDFSKAGTVTYVDLSGHSGTLNDGCTDTKTLNEFICENGNARLIRHNCSENEICFEGKCTEAMEVKINLSKGWNLISIPLLLRSYKPEDVFSSCLEEGETLHNAIFTFDNRYLKYPDEFQTLEIGKGYWVYLPRDCSAVFKGVDNTYQQIISIHEGWNLIGNPYNRPLVPNEIMLWNGTAELNAVNASIQGWISPNFFVFENGYKYVNIWNNEKIPAWKGIWILSSKNLTMIT